VWLEGLGQLKKSNYFIRNRTRDLLACGIVPQLTALLRVPIIEMRLLTLNFKMEEDFKSRNIK
jgi:hypothetical protein